MFKMGKVSRGRKVIMGKITEKKKYFVVRERAVPEVLLKVVQAKKLLDSEKVIAAVLSFVFTGRLNGVCEGTVIAALLVGYIARVLGKKLAFVKEKHLI